MADNKQRVRQHEPLRVPQGWTDQARSLVMQIERVFDKIFSLLGKHREDIDGKKDKQTAKTSPSASGSTLAFIDTISQDEEGVITATKKNVSVANNLTTTEAGSVLDARQGKALDDGKKNTQSAVSSPTASGTDVSFIDTISQNTQGVISATKKTVRTFVKSGADAATGLVPKPSTTAGTTKFLREDATWQVALTQHQDISGKKNTQTAKSDPSADGVSTSFIATLSQNAQGVITATKKKVAESFSIPASGSKTFNVGNSYRGVFFIIGGSAAAQDVITVYSTSSGSIAYQKMGSSANLTVTISTGAIKIANSNTYAQSCYVMTFSGSVS